MFNPYDIYWETKIEINTRQNLPGKQFSSLMLSMATYDSPGGVLPISNIIRNGSSG